MTKKSQNREEKKRKKSKTIDWNKALRQSQQMEKSENLRKLYRLFVDIQNLMEEMSPKLKKS